MNLVGEKEGKGKKTEKKKKKLQRRLQDEVSGGCLRGRRKGDQREKDGFLSLREKEKQLFVFYFIFGLKMNKQKKKVAK